MPNAARFLPLVALALTAQPALKFQGENVVLTEAKPDDSGVQAPASICVEWPEQRQCYTTPQGYSRSPGASTVQVSQEVEAILFSAATSGTSDYGIHFALLTKGGGRELQDLFFGPIEASDQSQHALWNEPSISGSKIFVIADYVWGPGETTHEPHRYMISAYVRKSTAAFDTAHYYLTDRYMTARKYDPQSKTDILTTEKSEILARLSRLK
jgi:hypothetical protein